MSNNGQQKIIGRLHLRPHLLKFVMGLENLAVGDPLELGATSVIRRYIGERLITKTQLGGMCRRRKAVGLTAILRYAPTITQCRSLRVFLTEAAENDINTFVSQLMMDMMQHEVRKRVHKGGKATDVYREFVDTYDIADDFDWTSLRRSDQRRKKLRNLEARRKKDGDGLHQVTGQILMNLK
jgi:hypothetical protein